MAEDLKEQGVVSLEQFSLAEQETGAAAQAAAVGVEILSMAVRTIAIAAIGAAISALVNWLIDLAHASENATREATELADAIKKTQSEIKDNKKFIEDISEEYEKLSKGVDELGENVSLSSEEFKRYNDITEDIGERFPQMIKGWTDEKNVILDTRDAVKSLNEEYEKDTRRRWAEFISNGEFEKLGTAYKEIQRANGLEGIYAAFTGSTKAGIAGSYDELNKFYSDIIDMTYDEYAQFFNTTGYNASLEQEKFGNMLMMYGDLIDLSAYRAVDEEGFRRAKELAIANLDSIESDMDQQIKSWRSAGQGLLDYNLIINDKHINEENQKAISSIINSIDEEFLKSIDGDTDAFMTYINSLVDVVGEMDSKAISQIFSTYDENTSFEAYKANYLGAWSEILDDFQRQIDQVTTEEEKKLLRDARNRLWQMTGGAEILEESNRFDAYLRSLSKSEEEYQMLKNATQGFSKSQMDAWYGITDVQNTALYNLELWENESAKAAKRARADYVDIMSLLSQDNPIYDWDRERINPDEADRLHQMYDDEVRKAEKAGADLERTVYGNIDLNNRGRIDWDEELFNRYSEEIESWYKDDLAGMFNEQFEQAYEKYSNLELSEKQAKQFAERDAQAYVDSYLATIDEESMNKEAEKRARKYLEKENNSI